MGMERTGSFDYCGVYWLWMEVFVAVDNLFHSGEYCVLQSTSLFCKQTLLLQTTATVLMLCNKPQLCRDNDQHFVVQQERLGRNIDGRFIVQQRKTYSINTQSYNKQSYRSQTFVLTNISRVPSSTLRR